jgi:hypothetical protein
MDMPDSLCERGEAVQQEVLGDAHVDCVTRLRISSTSLSRSW